MERHEVQVGQMYVLPRAGGAITVKITALTPSGDFSAINIATGKSLTITSVKRLKPIITGAPLAPTPTTTVAAPEGTAPEAPAAKPKKAKKPKDAPAKISLLDAAHTILLENGGDMTCIDIVQMAIDNEIWTGEGKTPTNTLNAAINREITTRKGESRFAKAARGMYRANGGS